MPATAAAHPLGKGEGSLGHRVWSKRHGAEAAPGELDHGAEAAPFESEVSRPSLFSIDFRRRRLRHALCFVVEGMEIQGLVTTEVLRKIRSDNRTLLERTESIQASLETGRFDDAAPIAAELGQVLRQHVSLVDGVLEALVPDDISPAKERS